MKIYSVGNVKTLDSDWQMYDIKDLDRVYKTVKGISDGKKIDKKTIANGQVEVKMLTTEFYRFQRGYSFQSFIKKRKMTIKFSLFFVAVW